MMRFGVVGVVSNVVLYVAYLGLTATGMGTKLAMSMVYVIGVMQTFLFNRRWTFKHVGNMDTAFIRYIGVYVGGYVTNLFVLSWLVDGLGFPHQIVQGVMILTLAVCFFLLQKFWVFKVINA